MANECPTDIPSRPDADIEATEMRSKTTSSGTRRPFLVRLTGREVGLASVIEKEEAVIGRALTCDVRLDETGVSRAHARIRRVGDAFTVEDLGSSNGTRVNGQPIQGEVTLHDGDKLHIGSDCIMKFALFDEVEERYHLYLHQAVTRTDLAPVSSVRAAPWSPTTWRAKPIAQNIVYDDPAHLERVLTKLRKLPPLVTSWEVEDLKRLIAECQQGKRFLLQGGDCAETHDECESSVVTNKLKIIIQMSLVLIRGLRRPVVRVGRFAGQYAKPRSKATETKDGVELPSYFGDLVNRPAFDDVSRRPDPQLLLDSYFHSAVTLNFIRSMSGGGFADLRRPEFFDLSFTNVELPTSLRYDYQATCREISQGMQLIRSFGDRFSDELMRVNFFASHEGLNLHYEESQTRLPPRRDRYYDLTTHMPWIGERTRQLDGAHIEFFRGIANPVGLKIGPKCKTAELIETLRALNPTNEPGKMVVIARMGAKHIADKLPPLVSAVRRAGLRVLWVSDPMHGNAITTREGIKTRDFADILSEVEASIMIHRELGSYLGGVHFELTGDDVTECIGGGLCESDLTARYSSVCDPRLNYRQALQMAFLLNEKLDGVPRPSSVPPPSLGR